MSVSISAENFKELYSQGGIQVLDVRTRVETSTQSISGALHVPLDELNSSEALEQLAKIQGELYLLCKSGKRAGMARNQLSEKIGAKLTVIDGGIDALANCGLKTRSSNSVWSLERQVRFTAGMIVVIGCLVALFAAPGAVWIPLLVGCGLMLAAATDSCAMGLLLARMPWNR